MILRWIIFISIYILIDIYAYQAIKTLTRNPWVAIGYILVSLLVLGMLIYQLSFSGSARLMMGGKMYIFGFFLLQNYFLSFLCLGKMFLE
jgi:hypothetical protein